MIINHQKNKFQIFSKRLVFQHAAPGSGGSTEQPKSAEKNIIDLPPVEIKSMSFINEAKRLLPHLENNSVQAQELKHALNASENAKNANDNTRKTAATNLSIALSRVDPKIRSQAKKTPIPATPKGKRTDPWRIKDGLGTAKPKQAKLNIAAQRQAELNMGEERGVKGGDHETSFTTPATPKGKRTDGLGMHITAKPKQAKLDIAARNARREAQFKKTAGDMTGLMPELVNNMNNHTPADKPTDTPADKPAEAELAQNDSPNKSTN